jgi:hypothetical protein
MTTSAQSVTEALHAEIERVPVDRREPLLRIIHAYREAIEEREIDPVESFRQGWKEVQAGQTRPIEGLWERIGLD